MKQKLSATKINQKIIQFLIISSGICFTTISCNTPFLSEGIVKSNKIDLIKVITPDYNKEILPLLISYKIIITNENETKTYFENPDSKSFTITVPKEKLTSILIYPVIKQDFFLPAGCIYPDDFYEGKKKHSVIPEWSCGPACLILNELLSSNDNNQIKAASVFNWTKLEETLSKKDTDSFNNFDELKTKKCTTANFLKSELLKSKILTEDSKISISYYDTKSLKASSIKDEDIYPETKIFCEYIPLNYFYKQKGWITLQNNSESKTAFLIDGKITYLSN